MHPGSEDEVDQQALEAPVEQESGVDGVVAEETPEKRARLGPGNRLDDEALLRELCALLFASPDPLSLPRLLELLRRPARERVRGALEGLEERLTEAGLPVVLREIGGGWRLFTAADQDAAVQRLVRARKSERLSPAALESLAIVAYRQPVTKAEIESIRGVQAGPVLRGLVDRGLIRITGRADQPGSPLQYGTTREFLDRFGIPNLKSLPRDSELVGE